ncbi:hypothetical protein ACWT_7924 [Actinoplanes sp. SE50]|uniref:hypothetical protein n=1 Tax=unclassified Actinoplanes TaxID=2626549 RepID=UPI00023EDFF7|nr:MULTISPECIES: hypothetical protein [unclassified Actinoplanes]AEV88933.1 hypothetical protein ACPL_8055 [Actinoplanes sp. SE50/110]ATO87339.1 hypothetical protein ACWT_7924 [Actinoplanes sp. SE50]SLM04757.1 hypothetical protein ACSP50_8065 [Actinoplanes sp. SE50/110]
MRARRIGQAVFYSAGLGPVSAASLGLAVSGRSAAAEHLSTGWQSRLGPPPALRGRPGPVVANALLGLLLGLLALIPLALEADFVARGILYGWVDRGPYDTSWGGPGRGGAWAVHFLVGVPIAVAGIAALIGLAAMHRRWTARLAGEPGGAWVLPVALLGTAAEVAFVIAFLRQI